MLAFVTAQRTGQPSIDGVLQPVADDAETGAGAHDIRDGGFPVPPPPAGPSADSRNLAALTHLSALVGLAGVPSFIGPLAVWLWQRDRDPYVVEQAREALNFNLSILIYVIGGFLPTPSPNLPAHEPRPQQRRPPPPGPRGPGPRP